MENGEGIYSYRNWNSNWRWFRVLAGGAEKVCEGGMRKKLPAVSTRGRTCRWRRRFLTAGWGFS